MNWQCSCSRLRSARIISLDHCTQHRYSFLFFPCVYVVCCGYPPVGGRVWCQAVLFISVLHTFSPSGTRSFTKPRVSHSTRVPGQLALRSALPTPSVFGLQSHMPAFAWVLSPQVQVSMIEQQAFYAGSHLPNPSFLISTLTLRIEEELVRLGGTYL